MLYTEMYEVRKVFCVSVFIFVNTYTDFFENRIYIVISKNTRFVAE